MKKISIFVILILLLMFSLNFYIKTLQKETMQLCEIFSGSTVDNGFNLKDAISIAEENGFEVSTTSDHGTQALFYKHLALSGLCIGTHKNGMLFNVKFHSHT